MKITSIKPTHIISCEHLSLYNGQVKEGTICYETSTNRIYVYGANRWNMISVQKKNIKQPKAMICSQCGASMSSVGYCEYCGTHYNYMEDEI